MKTFILLYLVVYIFSIAIHDIFCTLEKVKNPENEFSIIPKIEGYILLHLAIFVLVLMIIGLK